MQSGGAQQHGAAVVDMNADYDGLAVVWGIGHYSSSLDKCAEACRMYVPGPDFGGMHATGYIHVHCLIVLSRQRSSLAGKHSR